MIRFEYRLAGRGWSAATISDRESTAELSASYLSDALGDIARAVIQLLRGAPTATVSWAEEPGEYRWLLSRTDVRLTIRILWFDSVYAEQRGESGRMVFETTCRLVDFAGQLTSQLRALLETLGEAGYREQWVLHDFPRVEYETLVALRRERRARPT